MSMLTKVYENSPVWIQNAMVTGQGYIFAHRRWDLKLVNSYLAELRKSQWNTPAEFTEFQIAQLRKRVEFALTHVPFYAHLFKKHGLNCESFQTLDDLQRIPILEKKTVKEQPENFLRGGSADSSWITGFTSGTTGAPLQIYYTRDNFSRIWSFVFRLREWAGLEDPIFPRRVSSTGKNIVPVKSLFRSRTYWRRDLANNAMLIPSGPLSMETVPLIAEAISDFKPELVTGLPSVLTVMARYALQNGFAFHKPKAAITTGETLVEHDRTDIELAFGCKVYDQYASTDTSAFITECEHGSMHLNPEFGICELLNSEGNPAKAGERGEIVATPFCNTAHVFFRYRTGDSAIAGPPEMCRCGRSMPRIEAILGRTDDLLFVDGLGYVTSADSILASSRFSKSRAIKEAQIVQESPTLIILNVVPDLAYNDSFESQFLKLARDRFGHKVSIRINKVEQIPRGPNGKFRFIMSKVVPQYTN